MQHGEARMLGQVREPQDNDCVRLEWVGGGWWVGDDSGGPWVRGGPSLVSGLTLGRQLRILNQL